MTETLSALENRILFAVSKTLQSRDHILAILDQTGEALPWLNMAMN